MHVVGRWWIDVALRGRTARVELQRLITVRVDGRDLARLDDLWAAARLGPRPSELSFDFVGADGYRVSAKLEAGIDGGDLGSGYVCVATRDLVWAPSPERPCFWRVKGVVCVEAAVRVARTVAV